MLLNNRDFGFQMPSKPETFREACRQGKEKDAARIYERKIANSCMRSRDWRYLLSYAISRWSQLVSCNVNVVQNTMPRYSLPVLTSIRNAFAKALCSNALRLYLFEIICSLKQSL